MNKSKMLNIMIADDQYLFLESLKAVIENLDSQMKVVSTVLNGKEAIEKLKIIPVDCILLDVRMPIMDGVTASKIIHEKWPDITIIILTTFEDEEYVTDAIENGASGYLLKNISPQMLISGIRMVCNGSMLLAPDIAASLIQLLHKNKTAGELISGQKIPDWYYDLTAKERLIIKHILLNKTNSEIAKDIHVGPQTIRNYISSLYNKLDVSNRHLLIEKAAKLSSSLFS